MNTVRSSYYYYFIWNCSRRSLMRYILSPFPFLSTSCSSHLHLHFQSFSLFLNTRFHFECVYGPYYLLVYYLFKTHDKIACFQKVFSNAVASVSFSPKDDTFIPLRVELQVMGQYMSQLKSWSPIHFIWGLCLYISWFNFHVFIKTTITFISPILLEPS